MMIHTTHTLRRLFAVMLLGGHVTAAMAAETIPAIHGMAMHGQPKYAADFTHFDYVNPQAPRGGDVTLAATGTFNSLNAFIVKGSPATGLGRIYDTLLTDSTDEAFTHYGLVAQSMEVPADRSWVIFNLNPQARFHDGSAVTAHDVAFSMAVLKQQGHPFYRMYYRQVEATRVINDHRIQFTFSAGNNKELPLIVGRLPVLPAHYWRDRDFSKTTLEPPLGSGPYRIKTVDPGRSITYQRVTDYWGAELPVNRGRHNFNTLRIDYYRDGNIALQAFSAGELDFRHENVAKHWASAYDFPAVQDGRVIKDTIRHENPTGMQAFIFNIRRPLFADRRVREAIGLVYDFEWANKNLFFSAYTRTQSYFSNSELASQGVPTGPELALLTPFRDQLPPQLFDQPFQAPVNDGPRGLRANLRKADRLLERAGWTVRNHRRVHSETGEPLRFTILLVQPSFERVVLPFIRNLKRLGIVADARIVDASQYENRIEDADFDMIVHSFSQSLSPGSEQRNFWHSDNANVHGSNNRIGIADPVVDALIDHVIAAADRPALITATRALDRVLLWRHYVIPHWHIQSYRVAYWNRFGRPAVSPKYDLGFDTWWIESDTPRPR